MHWIVVGGRFKGLGSSKIRIGVKVGVRVGIVVCIRLRFMVKVEGRFRGSDLDLRLVLRIWGWG